MAIGARLYEISGIPSGYLLHSHGKSPFLIAKPSINEPFSMAMLNNQRVLWDTISCKTSDSASDPTSWITANVALSVLPVGMTPPLVKLHQLPLADLLASNLSCPERSIKGLGMFSACQRRVRSISAAYPTSYVPTFIHPQAMVTSRYSPLGLLLTDRHREGAWDPKPSEFLGPFRTHGSISSSLKSHDLSSVSLAKNGKKWCIPHDSGRTRSTPGLHQVYLAAMQ